MTFSKAEVAAIREFADRPRKIAQQKQRALEVAVAWQFVEGWLDDDEELRIPSNDFGHELHRLLRLLVDEMKKKESNR